MKKYIILLLGILTAQNLSAQRVTSYTQTQYRNLEKYWWYRYRLVNDFMKIGTACGESIPMEHWKFRDNGKNDKAYWGDATQHLGNYMNALAGEWRILHDCGLSTRRTEEELYYAQVAFDRLDKKAEPAWRDYDRVYPYCGTPDLPGIEKDDDLNGFFIRDDVPSLHTSQGSMVTLSTFVEYNWNHFHRPGFYYNTPQVDIEEGFGSQATVPGHTAQMPNGYTAANWPWARGPAEESQDQIGMLYNGMGMTGWLLGSNVTYNGTNLRENAREQLYRIFEWPAFNGCHTHPEFTVCNPVTNRCVGDPSSNNACNAGGGQIFLQSVGAVAGLSHIGLVNRAYSYPHSYGQMVNTTGNPAWEAAYQLLQVPNAAQFAQGGSNELFYANTYSTFANNWKIGFKLFGIFGPTITLKNTTKQKIAKHGSSQQWAWPHLPLEWQIINGQGPGSTVWFNAEEKEYGHNESYERLLSDAPFCGCHSYDKGHQFYRNNTTTGPDYGKDEDFSGQNAWQWSNANRLQDFGKRGDGGQNSDFNNLDYMVVWNLFTIIQGAKLTPAMMNPYYREDYFTNYGAYTTGYGSHRTPLKLNFLEYLSMKNSIYIHGDLRVRCAKVIDLKPGFQAHKGATFEAKVKDYRCQEEGYVYALAKDVPVDHTVGNKGTGDSFGGEATPAEGTGTDEDGYTPLDFPPDGVPLTIAVDSEQYYGNAPVDDSIQITEEDEQNWFNSLRDSVNASGDPDLIEYVEHFLANSESDYGERPANPGSNTPSIAAGQVQLYPNPTNGEFTILVKGKGQYSMAVYNTVGSIVLTSTIDGFSSTKFKLPDELPQGTYAVVIRSETNDQVFKKITLIR